MADLRTLLHASAPKPTSPLDLDALYARASRRPNRRLATWLGIAGLTLGIGIPGGSVLVTADRASDGQAAPPTVASVVTPVRVADASTTTTISAPSRAVSQRSTQAGRVAASAASSGQAGADDGARSSATPTTLRRATPTTTTVAAPSPSPSPSDYPRAAFCTVDNNGLGPNEQRRCRFTATAAGGASRRPYGDEVSSPQGQVLVTRNGTTTAHPVIGVQVFSGDVRRGCEDLFIQPGDLVELVLTNAASGTQEVMTIGAGERWQCYGDE